MIQSFSRRWMGSAGLSLTIALASLGAASAYAQSTDAAPADGTEMDSSGNRPNIIIIFPDDVGWSNVSAYGNGVMGYTTPNIDKLAREGAMFTEHYAEPSSTAGRAALITGQYPIRSGMTTVGLPGATLGIRPQTPTLAEVLKERGYATGQFGKNHLGDRNEFLPTLHGFDEFFGNLYHLNSEDLPEQEDYPKDPVFKATYGPRGVIHSWATDNDDATTDPRFGRIGKQRLEDTGPLTRKRMESVDQEFMDASINFVKRSQKAKKPFFLWLNPSRMHMFTHLDEKDRYLAVPHTTEEDMYGSGMMQHDRQVGEYLARLKQMGALKNTIVIYSTDNGPEHSARNQGGTTPFRGEKMTTYEGGVRVPFIVWWPGHVPAGQVIRGMQSHMDVLPTLADAAGIPNVQDKILRERKQIIDGVDNLDLWLGKTQKSKRDNYIYYYEGDIKAIRYNNWKVHFQTTADYYAPYVKQKFPIIYNLHADPFESHDDISSLSDGIQKKQWLAGPIQTILGDHIRSLAQYPPVQAAPSNDFSEIIRQLTAKNK